MFTRTLALPDRSFFLFGPRGTGKTTWLRAQLPDARWYDLLHDRELVRLSRDPGRLTEEIDALPAKSWIVIDEVQKLPALLNEVQGILGRRPRGHRFALAGSSARKLRRGDANLLAGRAVNRRFFPLTAHEMGNKFKIDDALRFGALPAVVADAGDDAARIDTLTAYAENYLTQEIRHEAVVKRLEPFTRFIEVAALANGQVTNVSSISRDASVARPTVQGYFEILVDTLIGHWVKAWRPRAKVKELAHPKFYFFDPGVVRALAGRTREPLGMEERGALFESYLLHELRAYLNHSARGGEISYWRTPSNSEVDFVWTRAGTAVGIEAKASTQWKRGFAEPLRAMLDEGIAHKGFGVYLGKERLRDGKLEVLPIIDFLERLSAGKVIPE